MTDQDRIRLAEAMGWTVNRDGKGYGPDNNRLRRSLPNPFTDANDDYAVLEWMRSRRDSLLQGDTDTWRKFMAVIHEGAFCTSLYQIGDYARAALKVIDD